MHSLPVIPVGPLSPILSPCRLLRRLRDDGPHLRSSDQLLSHLCFQRAALWKDPQLGLWFPPILSTALDCPPHPRRHLLLLCHVVAGYPGDTGSLFTCRFLVLSDD